MTKQENTNKYEDSRKIGTKLYDVDPRVAPYIFEYIVSRETPSGEFVTIEGVNSKHKKNYRKAGHSWYTKSGAIRAAVIMSNNLQRGIMEIKNDRIRN